MSQKPTLPSALQRPALTPIPRLLLSREDAATSLNLSVRTLDDLTTPRGPIQCVRVGDRVLYSPAVLQRWIESEIERPKTELPIS